MPKCAEIESYSAEKLEREVTREHCFANLCKIAPSKSFKSRDRYVLSCLRASGPTSSHTGQRNFAAGAFLALFDLTRWLGKKSDRMWFDVIGISGRLASVLLDKGKGTRALCSLFSWENVQGWPPLQRSSCSNGRILAEFLQDSGRMRPKSQTEEKQSRNDQIKIQRVASICRLPFSTLKTTGTKLLKMLQSLQCKKVTQGYARHKWQRRKKANKQFRQKDYILLYSFIICHALCIFMTLWASLGQDCRDLLLGTWLQVGYISARHENTLEVDLKSNRIVRSCQVCRANCIAPHSWVQSQRPQEIHKARLLKNGRRTGNCDTSMYNRSKYNQMYANASCHNLR